MKIRILIDAKLIGGTETHVMNLCQSLITRKHDCRIIFIRDYGNLPLYEQCKTKNIPYSKSRHYRDLIKTIHEEQPDIIHTHGYKANIIGRMLRPLFKGKLIATYHAGEPPVGRLFLYNFLDRWTSFFSHNIAVNADIAAQLPSRSDVVPNFVNIPEYINKIKAQSPYNVFFIGRFSPEKDPLSFCKLATMKPNNFYWHAVGDGPLIQEAIKIAQDKIHFYGPIINMDDIWPKVDLLCITSLYEGLPLVLLEAMSRGIPVVSFDVGTIKSIIQNNDYIIESSDLSRMHDAINSHFAKPLEYREELAKQARQTIQNNFSSPLISSKIEDIYQRCFYNDQ